MNWKITSVEIITCNIRLKMDNKLFRGSAKEIPAKQKMGCIEACTPAHCQGKIQGQQIFSGFLMDVPIPQCQYSRMSAMEISLITHKNW